jgi:tripartite-type tricarboxylate transporter receptor subunit TctC
MKSRCGLGLVAILVASITLPLSALAAFPERDITLVVPWAAGGGTDTLARTLVKNSKKFFGVNMNVINRVGGTGVVGMNSVAMSKPDGYTVAVVTFHLSAYRLLGMSDLSYRDYDLIALLNDLLGGALTLRFALKAIVVGVIAGGLFAYYLHDLRRSDADASP